MFLKQINRKQLTVQSFILLFILTLLTTNAHAGYLFPHQPTSDAPTEQADNNKKGEKNKKGKRFEKLGKKFNSIIRKAKDKLPKQDWSTLGADDKYGTIALWTLVAGMIVGLINSPVAVVLTFLLGLTSLVTAIMGYSQDANPKKAKIVLIINLIVVIITVILILAILAVLL